MSSRNGKIACLPLAIRNEVNRRLDDGQGGPSLLEWLNGLPEVQTMLARSFGGRSITKQNLYGWRIGGYCAWQGRNEMWSQAKGLAGDAGKLSSLADGQLAEHLATVLAARYAVMMSGWEGEVTDRFKERLRALSGLCRDISVLRRDGHSGERLELRRDGVGGGKWEDPVKAGKGG